MEPDSNLPVVSVVLPVLNEEEALGTCIEKIQRVCADSRINAEIVIADNGSTDRSVEIAQSMGVRVVHQPLRGYGNAYIKGFASARGNYLVMADADDTYDFNLIPDFVNKLANEGYEFVTGSRYLTGGENITLLHRYVGNPLLTFILNSFFGTKYSDVYCGYRAFTRQAFDLIQPVSPGMEFNLELAINAHLANLKIAEIPIRLAPRLGTSKLNTWRDGWRSLRMMLLYCPDKAFLLPGLSLLILGMTVHLLTLLGIPQYEGRSPAAITGLFGTIFTVTGVEILSLWLHAKTYSWSRRFERQGGFVETFYKYFNLESGLAAGTLMFLTGILILLMLIVQWLKHDLMPLPQPQWAPVGASFIITGMIIVFSSLFISAMAVTRSESRSKQ